MKNDVHLRRGFDALCAFVSGCESLSLIEAVEADIMAGRNFLDIAHHLGLDAYSDDFPAQVIGARDAVRLRRDAELMAKQAAEITGH